MKAAMAAATEQLVLQYRVEQGPILMPGRVGVQLLRVVPCVQAHIA